VAKLWARRRLFLGLTLCVVAALFAVTLVHAYVPGVLGGASTPGPTVAAMPTATPAAHDTFLFSFATFPPGPLHPGAQVRVQWVPTSAPRDATAGAAPVACTVAVYGPYATGADATRSIDDPANPQMTPAFTTLPLTLNDWMSVPQAAEVMLPATLRPSYYLVLRRSVRALDNASQASGSLLRVVL